MARRAKQGRKAGAAFAGLQRGPAAVRQWAAAVPRHVWGTVLKITLGVLILAGLGLAATAGMKSLKDRLRGADCYVVGPEAVHVVTEPPLPIPPAVRTRLQEETGLPARFNLLDEGLLRQLADHYAAQPWVLRVERVRRVYPDRIEAELTYRKPAAFVTRRDPTAAAINDYYWVDEQGVRLPGVFSESQVENCPGLMVICRVAAPPPPEGQPWLEAAAGQEASEPAKDLAAGLRLAAGLAGRPARREVRWIDVANYAGRINPVPSHLVLLTPDGTRIYWGGAPGEERYGEIPFDRKLANLDYYYAKDDDKKPGLQDQFIYINVSLPRITVLPRPHAAEAGHQG